MTKTCCICGNTQVEPNEDVIFFDFPISAHLRRKWKNAIQLSTRITYDTVICNKHFEKYEYYTLRGRPRLIGRVVPTLFLNNANNATKENSLNEDNLSKTDLEKRSNVEENSIDNGNTEEPLTEQPSTDKRLAKSDRNSDIEEKIPELDTEINLDLISTAKSIKRDAVNSETDSITSQGSSIIVPNSNSPKTSDYLIQTLLNEMSKDNSKKVIEEKENSISDNIEISSNTNGEINLKKSVTDLNKRRYFSKKTNSQNRSRNAVSDMKSTSISSPSDPKEDIEDLLTNYHIQNKGQLVMESDSVGEKQPEAEPVKENDPVFIEISVGKDPHSSAPGDAPGSQDCLMVLESVQVDVDPSNFLLPEQEYDIAGDDDDDEDDVQVTETKKPDPISLLTSSDESDVILEEPKIDTVEVSDETDEDDVPLVRLLPTDNSKKSDIAKIMWGLYEYYCVQCKFYSTNKSEYFQHVKKHEKVLQMCQICGYTTASKCQFERHRRKHKDERRFKCHLCDYKARHNMSLIYHLKNHETRDGAKRHAASYSCHCGFGTDNKSAMLKHVRSCKGKEDLVPRKLPCKTKVVVEPKKYTCKQCSYSTKRRADLRRHVNRKHIPVDDDDDNDEDYVP